MSKILIACLAALALSGAAAPAAKPEAGWWCESQHGSCWALRDGCDDQSCHWQKHAWVVYYGETYAAWETQRLCDRFRRPLLETNDRPSDCQYLRNYGTD